MYEESQAENALLREKLRKTEEELNQIKSQPDKSVSTIEQISSHTSSEKQINGSDLFHPVEKLYFNLKISG